MGQDNFQRYHHKISKGLFSIYVHSVAGEVKYTLVDFPAPDNTQDSRRTEREDGFCGLAKYISGTWNLWYVRRLMAKQLLNENDHLEKNKLKYLLN